MRRMMFLIVFVMTSPVFSQQSEKEMAQGNRHFKKEAYAEAEAAYRVSQSRSQSGTSAYNLGNAIYRLEKPAEAKLAYANALKNAKTRTEKHQAYHNIGNVLMKEKNYQGAVQAYKNALINNPSDDQTRYNYALAKKMLKENPPKNDGNQDKNQDQGGDKDEENKDDSQPKDNEKGKNDEPDQKNQPDPKDPEDQQQPAPQPQATPGGISKERMENLLDAVNNEERKVQDKVKATQEKGRPVRNEKDW